jgi:ribosomal protein S18 acetylase RimI-like enzyme
MQSEIASPPPAPPASSTGKPTYKTRVLPVGEWERLLELPFGANGLPDENFAIIIVTEDPTGAIVGVWAAVTAVHLDGLWVDPNHRDTPIAGQLLRQMKATLQEKGVAVSFTLIQDTDVMVLAHKAGFVRSPWDLWQLTLPLAEG